MRISQCTLVVLSAFALLTACQKEPEPTPAPQAQEQAPNPTPAPPETSPTITIDFPGAGSFDSVPVGR